MLYLLSFLRLFFPHVFPISCEGEFGHHISRGGSGLMLIIGLVMFFVLIWFGAQALSELSFAWALALSH